MTDTTKYHLATAFMTLREYYAGQALNGMLAHQLEYVPQDYAWHKNMAKEAFDLADMMIAVSEQNQ